jgi:hypothetical protein
LEWHFLHLDGHESHCNYLFLDFAWRYRILIFVLPAHSTHLTQPLDIGLFGPLQRYYGVLLAEWFKGGYPAISREDFIPLLQQARERTYTIQNIKGAWAGAGLVPYDRRRVQSRLDKGIIPQKAPESPVRAMKTPKQSHEFRQILKYSEQLVLQDGPKELLLSALEKLSKPGIQAQVQEAVARHETAFLKKRLDIEANYHKSRVRMNKKEQGYAKLMTQDDVNEALEEYNARQKKLAEIAIRKSKKEEEEAGGKSKGKRATRKGKAPAKAPMASGGRSGTQISDSEG